MSLRERINPEEYVAKYAKPEEYANMPLLVKYIHPDIFNHNGQQLKSVKVLVETQTGEEITISTSAIQPVGFLTACYEECLQNPDELPFWIVFKSKTNPASGKLQITANWPNEILDIPNNYIAPDVNDIPF